METSRFVSFILILLQVSSVPGNRLAIDRLNNFKADIRKEIDFINDDISTLFKVVENITKTTNITRDGNKDVDKISDDINEPRGAELTKQSGSVNQEPINDDLMKRHLQLMLAFQTEKRLNRHLQQRLDVMEERVNGLYNEMTSFRNTVSKDVDRKIQTVRKDVLTVDDNVKELVGDVRKVEEVVQIVNDTINEDVKSVRENVKKVSITVQQVNETVQKVSENVDKISIQVHDNYGDVTSSTTIPSLMTEPRHEVTTTTSGDYRVTCKTVPTSGMYDIYIDSMNANVRVYCDQDTDGGGWIVVMRRKDGSVNFTRSWQDYKNGFGNLNGEFWSGNDFLHNITKSKPTQLRIDMEDFDGNKKFAQYEKFQIGPEEDKYRLTVSDYSGTAGDSLIPTYYRSLEHNEQQFSTYDSDNDNYDGNCAEWYGGGGWWFNACMYSHLTGIYRYDANPPRGEGIRWQSWGGRYTSVRFVEMKIRRV